jgi:flagellar protein FlaI
MTAAHHAYVIEPHVAQAGGNAILSQLLADDQVEEIMYNGPRAPFLILHRQHGACAVSAGLDEQYVWHFAQHVASQAGARIDTNTPVFEGSLGDGSRIHITSPPVSPHGVTFTIRKFLVRNLTIADMVGQGALDADTAAFVWSCVDGFRAQPMNLLVVGGTGTGKTTFLNALTQLIPLTARIVVIEDTQEIRVLHQNAVRLVAGPQADMDHLLRSALRMRPDRILVGEVRGAEANTLLTAMNTGHRGCLGTLHANSAKECLDRLRNAPMNVPLSQLMGIDMVLSLARIDDGQAARRVVTEIVEVSGYGEGVARSNQLYAWNPRAQKLEPTGVPSRKRALLARGLGWDHGKLERAIAARASLIRSLAGTSIDAAAFAAQIAVA